MHKHSKKTPGPRSALQYKIFTILGVAWIIASIFLLTRSPMRSLSLLAIILLPIGGAMTSYGIVYRDPETRKESRADILKRIILFSIAVSIASFVILSWAYIYAFGL